MRSVIAILSAVLLAGCAAVAGAGPLLDVEIVSRSSGRVLETYTHRGRTYVAGKPGESYAVRLVSRSRARLLAVLSVDGVNAVTGETASPAQSGYVLDPYSSAEISGWRKSLEEVAQFYFTSLPDSYAARTDRPENVGVIGVAVFRERPPQRPQSELEAPQSKAEPAAPSAGAGRAAQDSLAESAAPDAQRKESRERLGTGHGAREYAPTEYTEFVRAGNKPDAVVAVRYDSYDNLLARGIIPHRPRYADPQPFPRRFVPDPRG